MAGKVCLERDKGELVGAAEAAEILETKVPQITRWKNSGVMPPAVDDLKATTVWLRADVKKLAEKRKLRGASN